MAKKIKGFMQSILNYHKDVRSSIFLLVTAVAVIALVLAIIGDIVIGENPAEILILIATVLAGPILTCLAIKNDRLQLGAVAIAAGIVFLITPIAFVFGGGLTGGGVIWFCFAYIYIGLTVKGRTRIVMVGLLTVEITALYILCYYYPQLAPDHDKRSWFVDSLVSVILVGYICYYMVVSQYRLYLAEYEKAKEQAQEIEEMNRAQSKFFSSMSHEIRTPINTIIGLNEMTLRENAGPEVAENARNIQAASKILLSLINDILDMSKIESGKMDIVKVHYDVGKMLSEIVSMVWVKAYEKGLDFSVSVDPGLPAQLFSDEVRIKQILINLLNNAVKYTPAGSVTLSVHCVRTGGNMARVTYSVQDTGMGIKKENIPHLFDAFRREDTEKNRYIEGTGLGLSIVKQLVDLLGGTISVSSVYTKGSTFEVEIEQEIVDESIIGDFSAMKLNRADEAYAYHQSFEAPEAKILVVDDNSTNLLVVKKLLKDTKVQVTCADSGKAGLEQTLTDHFDLILMDHLMPEMDGIACMHAVRDQAGGLCKNTPVVALTANAGSENQALYRREGFDEYLVKPVDPVELEKVVRTLLPHDKVIRSVESDRSYESDRIVREMRKKVPVLITTESMADLPPDIQKRLGIPVIPCCVRMDRGLFYDGEETDSDGIVRYMEDSTVIATSEAPTVEEYEAFFSEMLTKAQHIIHITTAKYASHSFANACEAALSFYNVRVVDSGNLSSGTGLLALYGFDLADSGQQDTEVMVDSLEKRREKIEFSFIIRTTEYLFRGGRLSFGVNKLCDALMLHPIISTSECRIQTRGIIAGNYERVKKKYIRSVLKDPDTIDTSVLFITYVGMRMSELRKVRETVEDIITFDRVYVTKAAPSIAINCGPGTFGLIFARK
ncbi:MAG: DegV family EDD domain-containing protein [Lachnospiraceae bacterium]|nr:DegV family EDD domain-containing protein [Lachnospiraceae bacterium]